MEFAEHMQRRGVEMGQRSQFGASPFSSDVAWYGHVMIKT